MIEMSGATRIQHCSFCGSRDARQVKSASRSKLLAQYLSMHGLYLPAGSLGVQFRLQRYHDKAMQEMPNDIL